MSDTNGKHPGATGETDEGDEGGALSEQIRSRLPDRPSMADHESTLASIADELRSATVNVGLSLSLSLSRVLPFTERFWRGLYKAGLRGLHKKAGTDYLGMIMVGGEIKPVPVDWDYDAQRFENRHGDWWKAPSEGEYRYRMAGKVPTIWASSTSNHIGSHMQAEVAEALDLGRERDLYSSAQVRVEQATIDAGANGNGQAVADGGEVASFTVTGSEPGMFADQVVPLTNSDEYDARAVSVEKYYETYPETTDSEEMKMQEKRGEMAMNDRDAGKLALKLMLIAAGIIAVVILGPPIVDALLGGGGGGGGGGAGSAIPLTLGALGVI